jgi:hypothetical protein
VPSVLERGDAVGPALVGDADVDLRGADIDVAGERRMTSKATPRSASIVQNVCRSACAVRQSSRTPAVAVCLATTSPTAPAEIGSGTADGRVRRLTNSAWIAACRPGGAPPSQRVVGLGVQRDATDAPALRAAHDHLKRVCSRRAVIAARRRGSGLAAAFLDVCERQAGEL